MLPQPATHPTIFRVISLSPRIHYHYFKLTDAKQIDARFRRLLGEGFKVGRREHVRMRGATPPGRSLGATGKGAEPLRRVFIDTNRPLWRCPKCGNYFVSRNLAHSCVRVPLESHFEGKDALVRKTFDALVAALRSIASAQDKRTGPIRIVSSKTRIAFMVRMRFGSVTPEKHALPGGFFLTRPVRHPLLTPGLTYGSLHGYRFVLTHPKQIDAAFRRLLAEAYQVGAQKHLERK